MQGSTIGNSLKVQGLADLAEWTKREKFPAITGLIIDKTPSSENYLNPGDGYFRLFGKKFPDHSSWWLDQIKQSLAFDWDSYLTPAIPAVSVQQRPQGATLTHICISDPDHLKSFESAAAANIDCFDWWNINKFAMPGDRVIFYMTAPLSGFVACGVVDRIAEGGEIDKTSQWYGPHCYWISELQLFSRRLKLSEAKIAFPDWSYLAHPVVTSIPNEKTSSDIARRFLALLHLPPRLTDKPTDLPQPPDRVETTTYRILRDTELARSVKELHGYECQMCGHVMRLPNGNFYAEAHHIQPLGRPHDGHDVEGNILCLCPNHHAELDYGTIPIEIDALRSVEGHMVVTKYVEYHNRRIHLALLEKYRSRTFR